MGDKQRHEAAITLRNLWTLIRALPQEKQLSITQTLCGDSAIGELAESSIEIEAAYMQITQNALDALQAAVKVLSPAVTFAGE